MDDIYELPPWGFGSAHSISCDTDEKTVIERLHEAIEEITGAPVERPSRKIGFY